MKICSTCKLEKPLNDFAKASCNLDGLRGQCKTCMKQWRLNNSERLKEYDKKYREKNKENIKQQMIQWILNNKEHIKEYKKTYNKIYKEKNKEHIKEYKKTHNKIYNEKNKEKLRLKAKEYRIKNKDKINKYKKEWMRNKMKTDYLFKLKHSTRTLISLCLRNNGYSKTSKTFKILGCTPIEFKEYLEKQFTDGMSWDNQGKWHLDHIYPVSLAKDEEELIRLNHYTNFQPLWAIDNIRKSNKVLNG